MKNFFNALGVAGLEKVHSAMIAWILDDSNDPSICKPLQPTPFSSLPIKDRSKFLCDLFIVCPSKDFKSIRTHVEWNDIDIMIETEDIYGNKEIWVIENKLKSQEHLSNINKINGINYPKWQTEKYEDLINTSFPTKSKHFMLLSLGGDKAQSQSGLWHSFTYNDMTKSLKSISALNKYIIVQEYFNALDEMNSELNTFLSATNYRNYQNVFKKLKKAQKASVKISSNERYIVDNNLETVFQKQFLTKLVKSLPSCNPVRYDERNGTSMFVTSIQQINPDFLLLIEFQGGTFKVALHHKDYINPQSNKEARRIYGTWDKLNSVWTGTIYNIFVKYNNQNGWHVAVAKGLSIINNLKNNKVKPRIAIDKNIGSNWYVNCANGIFSSVYNEALNLQNVILQSITSIP